MLQRRLAKRLHEVARRYTWQRLFTCLAATWFLLAAAGAAVIWWDAQREQSPVWAGPILLGVGLLAAAAIILWQRFSSWRPQWLAARIESRFPELDSRLLAAVEQEPEMPMGRLGYLQETVVRESLEHAQKHPWTAVVPTARLTGLQLMHWLGFALCAVVLIQLFALRGGAESSVAAPALENTVLPQQLSLEVEPGDAEVERGSSLLVLARFQGPLPAGANLVIVSEQDQPRALTMSQSLKDPVFVARVPEIREDLRYRVEYANQQSRAFQVTVFEYPQLLRVDAELEFPNYTGLEKSVVEDTRRITAVEGTQLTLICHVNKPLARAWLEEEDDADNPLTLSTHNQEEQLFSVQQKLKKSRRYRLHLEDAQGRRNRLPPEIVINVIPNQPPQLSLAWPRRDVQVSPLEELKLKAKASDDFGLRRIGLAYHLAGADPREVVLASAEKPNQDSEVRHTVLFEELKAKPDQLLSYYFWAEDAGPDGQDRRVFSDMFFAEVRRFEEIFRQGEQPPNGSSQQQQQQQQQQQGSQNAQQAEKLADLQKQIINATWTLIRRETAQATSEKFLSDVKLLEESQQQALEQVDQLAERVEDEESVKYVQDVKDFMNEALQHLAAARDGDAVGPLQPALSAEQSAYQALLRLRAREHEVIRGQQQNQQSSSSSSSQSRNRQQLDQLELQQNENRYETQRQAAQQQQQQQNEAQREDRQILNRLRELARRQEDLNKRMKELQSALEAAETEQQREEVRRQLKRLRDEQQQILRDLDETNQRMQQSQNPQEKQEAQQQLQQARENVRQASEALQQERLSQAAAEGARAGQRFENLREEFRRRTAGQFDEKMKEMSQAAQQLEERQQELGQQIAESEQTRQRSLRGDQRREEIQQGLQSQRQQLGSLLEEMKQTVQEAEPSEPLLSKRLYEAWRNAEQQKLDNALDMTRQLLEQGFVDEAQPAEAAAREGIQQLNRGVQRAAESVLGDEGETMRRAQAELQQLAEELNEEIDSNDPNQNQAANRQEGSQQGQQGQPQQGQQGQPQQGQQGQPQQGQQGQPQQGQQGQPQQGQQGQPQQGQQGQPQQGQQGQPQQGQQGQPQQGQQGQPQQGQQGQPQQGQQGQPQQGQQGQPQQAQQGQQGQRSGARPGSSQAREGSGDPNGVGGLAELFQEGNRPARPLTGEGFREWSDRLRDVEEMLEDPELANEAARIRDRARAVRAEWKRHSLEPKWPLVRQSIAKPLNELLSRIEEEVAKRAQPDQLRPIDRDPVPAEFIERVRKYYEEIGKGTE